MQGETRLQVTTALFITIPPSPWSEKARWALDHHRISYSEKPYLPLMGEPALRWKLRRARSPRGKVTVPILFAGGAVYRDSYDIAQYAEQSGSGAPLFPGDQLAKIGSWNELSERIMADGRARFAIHGVRDTDAKAEGMPGFMPRWMRRLMAPMAKMGFRVMQRKHGMGRDEKALRERLREGLVELRKALSGGRTHLVGDGLTYADICMATALQAIKPADQAAAPAVVLGPGMQRCWTDEEQAVEFVDLLGWRDRIYARHRRLEDRVAAAPAALRSVAGPR